MGKFMKLQGLKAQRGITLIGFILVLAVAGVFLFVGMKLVPVYTEYYSALTDIKAVCKEQDSLTADVGAIRRKIERRFFVSYIENIDIKKNIKLVREGDKKLLSLTYEVRKPLIYNLDFVAKFDHSEPIVGGSGAGE
jgi:Domain of unknown function (DUF4845)